MLLTGMMPLTLCVGEIVNVIPLHVTTLIAVICGTGLTVTITVNVVFAPHNGLLGRTV